MTHDVLVLAAGRSPVTGRSRAQAGLDAGTLAGRTVRALLETAPAGAPRPVEVRLGNCTGPGGNLGRIAALAAGLGERTAGQTLDAQCGSGAAAVQSAADRVALGGRALVAGGVESPSTAPVRVLDGVPYAQAPMAPPGFPDPGMLAAAEDLAGIRGIGRERQEAFAARSHALALARREDLAREILPGWGWGDDGPRRTNRRTLARFRPVLDRPGATVTPGTTARIADGACALLLAPAGPDTEDSPACRIAGHTTVGADPALPGIVPVEAVRTLLRETGTGLDELGAVELVEAFAVQALAVLEDLELAGPDAAAGEWVDPRANAWGGALALGHPWGASGAMAVTRLYHRLLAEPLGTRGVAACAIGGGMASALMLERVQ